MRSTFLLTLCLCGTVISHAESTCKNLVSARGALSVLEKGARVKARDVSFRVSFEPDQVSYKVSSKYKLTAAGSSPVEFLVPVSSQIAEDPGQAVEDFCGDVKVLVNGSKTNSTASQDEIRGEWYCHFSGLAKKGVINLELEFKSVFDSKAQDGTSFQFALFPHPFPMPVELASISFDPGPWKGKIPLRAEGRSIKEFLRLLGDPNVPGQASLKSVEEPSKLTLDIPIQVPRLDELQRQAEAQCLPGARKAREKKLSLPDAKDELEESYFPEPPAKLLSAGKCRHPMTSSSPAAARVTKAPQAAQALHAPSEKLPGACQGQCPSSYYVMPPSPELAKQLTEVHIVGAYNPDRTTKTIRVNVEPTTKPATLVLVAYEPTEWIVQLGNGARVEKIYYGGFDKGLSKVKSDLPQERVIRIPAEVTIDRWEPQNSQGDVYQKQYFQIIRGLAGQETSFQGSYDGSTFKVPFYKSYGLFAQREARFQSEQSQQKIEVPGGSIIVPVQLTPFFYSGSQVRQPTYALAPYNLRTQKTGPNLPQAKPIPSTLGPYAEVPALRQIFSVKESSLHNFTTGEILPLPKDLPPFDLGNAIAFDSKRNRLIWIGMSYSGTSYTYFYHMKTKNWGVIGKAPRLNAMAYDPQSDSILAVSDDRGSRKLGVYTPDLKRRGELPLNKDVPINASTHQMQIVDGVLTLITFAGSGRNPVQLSKRLIIDPVCGEVLDLL